MMYSTVAITATGAHKRPEGPCGVPSRLKGAARLRGMVCRLAEVDVRNCPQDPPEVLSSKLVVHARLTHASASVTAAPSSRPPADTMPPITPHRHAPRPRRPPCLGHTALDVLLCLLALLGPLTSTPAPASATPFHTAGLRSGGSFVSAHTGRAHRTHAYGKHSVPSLDDAAPQRQLLHGPNKPWKYPFCPRCRLIGCSNGYFTGHCRAMGKLFNCSRKKQSTASAQIPGFNTTLTAAPPELEPAGTALQVTSTINATAVAPYAACLRAADCALPARDFADVNGSAPLSANGTIEARCSTEATGSPAAGRDAGGFVTAAADAAVAKVPRRRPGLCVCAYSGGPGSIRGASTTSAAELRKGSRASSLRRTARRTVSGLCVRKPVVVPGEDDDDATAYVHADHAITGPEIQLAILAANATDGSASGTLAFTAAGTASCSVGIGGPEENILEDSDVGEVIEVFDEDYEDDAGGSTSRVFASVRQDDDSAEIVELVNSTGRGTAQVRSNATGTPGLAV